MALPATTYDTATLVNPSSSLTDFALVVDLSRMSAAWWAAVDTTDGTKGRAAKDSGPTELACDWLDFDSVNETGWLRVKWSGTLASSGTQTLRVYPPQAANASVSASDTYGSNNAYNANYELIVDLASGGWTDRTGNLTATTTNAPSLTSGPYGDAADFTGSDYVTYASFPSIAATAGFAEFWADITSGTYLTGIGFNDVRLSDDGSAWRFQWSGASREVILASTPSGTNAAAGWQYVAFAVSSSVNGEGFINGADETSSTRTMASATGSGTMTIGGRSGFADFTGELARVAFASERFSAAWVASEYEQMDDQATFWGTWTNVPVAAGISIPVVMHHRRMMGVS